MNTIYTFLTYIVDAFLPILSLFSKKIKFFYRGRKLSFSLLQAHISPEDKVIWIHTASLGEYEQGLPIIKELKRRFPEKKLVVTFFSPSGYYTQKWLYLSNMNFGRIISMRLRIEVYLPT